jgi:hypothetical protein
LGAESAIIIVVGSTVGNAVVGWPQSLLWVIIVALLS